MVPRAAARAARRLRTAAGLRAAIELEHDLEASVGEKKTVAVIGASNNRSKYGNRAVRAYRAEGWDVYPVHPSADRIEGLEAYRSVLDVPVPVDRATVYLPPETTLAVLPEIARKGVRELFLNPGSESSAVVQRAQELGLLPILACSIVDIGRSPSHPD